MKKIFTLIISGFFFGLLPLAVYAQEHSLDFVPNRDQWERVVRYKVHIASGSFFITDRGFTYSFYDPKDLEAVHDMMHQNGVKPEAVNNAVIHCFAYRVNFLNVNKDVDYNAEDKKSYYHNYFLGNDPVHWAGHVSVFGKVVQHNVYNGIDVAVYSNDNHLEYDLIVSPNADVGQLALQYEGAAPVITPQGSLKMDIGFGIIEEGKPYAYQLINGQKETVACSFKKLENGHIVFDFPEGYDHSKQLIIDPVLVFGTFSGGTGTTYGFSACYDNAGALYAGGESFDNGWPAMTGAFQTTFGGNVDCGINKYSPDGSSLIYSTYYGGSASETPDNMVTNAAGELAVMGGTTSTNLPVTPGCFQSTNASGGGYDFFVAHFSADGASLIGATYVGGNSTDGFNSGTSNNYGDGHRGEIFYDNNGNLLVAGSTTSEDFPITPATAAQSTFGGYQDGVVFSLSPDCQQLLYSTYLGGSDMDACFALVMDSAGDIVVCGGTKSSDFPTTTDALHATYQGNTDGFISIINMNTGLQHSTYLGTGYYDHAFKVQMGEDDKVLVMGQTSGSYPISAGVYSVATGNIFIDKLSADLSTSLLATRLGSNATGNGLVPTAFMYDVCGNTYLCGFDAYDGFPVTSNAFQPAPAGGGDFWLCTLGYNFTSLVYATYMGSTSWDHVDGGSSRFDPNGIVYHSVCTNGADFPTTSAAYAPIKLAAGYDVGSFKFNFEAGFVHAAIAIDASSSDSVCVGGNIQFDNLSTNGTDYYWDFGDGDTSLEFEPGHIFNDTGTYHIMLAAYNPNECNPYDTAYIDVHILMPVTPVIEHKDAVVCNYNQPVSLTATVDNLTPDMTFSWQPVSAILSDPNSATISVDPSISNVFYVTVTSTAGNHICEASTTDTVHVLKSLPEPVRILNNDTTVCIGDSTQIRIQGNESYSYSWSPEENFNNAKTKDPTVVTLSNTIYNVTATDSVGCSVFDSFMIDVMPCCNLVLANAFTPNADGKNDIFYLQTEKNVLIEQFSIFNRMGQLVFSTVNPSQGWDGTFGTGKNCDVGVYYYYLRYKCFGGTEAFVRKGDITLLR